MFHSTKQNGTAQHTIGRDIAYHGIGPFDGRTVVVNIHPDDPGSGIRFVRTDVEAEHSVICADWHNFVDARHGTVLGNQHGITVTYAEHILTPLRECGIDNAVIELNGPEVPRPDGGYASLYVMVERAGIVEQHAAMPGIWVEYPSERRDVAAASCQ